LSAFEKEGHGSPATTLTIALLVWPRTFLVHVGDSRAYHRRDGHLRRLTRDQTLGSYLVEQRAMSEQQVEKAGYHNVLTSAIGASDMTPVVGVLDLEPGDALLLCTDGLTNEVPDGEIDALLADAADPERTCRALVDRALERGGRDNITAIVAYALAD
jgi:protein phosphatase